VSDAVAKLLAEKEIRPAMQPKVEVVSYAEGKDLEFTLACEILPVVSLTDFSALKLTRLKAEADDAAIDDMLKQITEANRGSKPVAGKRAAKKGDILVIDFDGTVGGKSHPGMKAEKYELELGSGRFVGDFEAQLEGKKPGDKCNVAVTFPEHYGAKDLAGKDAVFAVVVHEIRESEIPEIDDAFAKKLGLADAAALRKAVADRIEKEYAQVARGKLKRDLLDALDDAHDFPLPETMVDAEFEAIWKQVEEEKKHGHLSKEEMEMSEKDLKAEYRDIAERRVRLGLLLAEVGAHNKLNIGEEELRRALIQEASRYPGQERVVFEFYKKNPQALEQLKAPLFEDKVVDFIIEIADVAEEKVSRDELMKEEAEEGHHHHHGHARAGKKSVKKSPAKAEKPAKAKKAEEKPAKAKKAK